MLYVTMFPLENKCLFVFQSTVLARRLPAELLERIAMLVWKKFISTGSSGYRTAMSSLALSCSTGLVAAYREQFRHLVLTTLDEVDSIRYLIADPSCNIPPYVKTVEFYGIRQIPMSTVLNIVQTLSSIQTLIVNYTSIVSDDVTLTHHPSLTELVLAHQSILRMDNPGSLNLVSLKEHWSKITLLEIESWHHETVIMPVTSADCFVAAYPKWNTSLVALLFPSGPTKAKHFAAENVRFHQIPSCAQLLEQSTATVTSIEVQCEVEGIDFLATPAQGNCHNINVQDVN